MSELIGAELDAAVAKALGHEGNMIVADDSIEALASGEFFYVVFRENFRPSTDWSQGGPIIERKWITIETGRGTRWRAWAQGDGDPVSAIGPTPLIAAMRAFVASKEGS